MSHQSSQHPTEEHPRIKGINHRKRPYELWAKVEFFFRPKPYWTRLGRYRTPAERDIAKEAHSRCRCYVEFADKKPEIVND